MVFLVQHCCIITRRTEDLVSVYHTEPNVSALSTCYLPKVLMILVEALVLSPHSKSKENTFLYQ